MLKTLVPPEVRTRLKWVGYALRDIVDPVRAPRVPPRRQTFIGGGDFEEIGNAFLETLKHHGLKPDMHVLDVGCGQGRMARPLACFLSRDGDYRGFDIVRDGIDWCHRHYADLPNFNLIHANVCNRRYNPGGTVSAEDYRFPFEDDAFDLTFLASVFTHMFAGGVENYLSEITRTLKPGGAVLITWFLLNDVSRRTAHKRFQFRHKVDGVARTTVSKNPEAAIAFDEDYIRGLYARVGLEISDVEYGQWGRPGSSRKSSNDLQDLVIARKLQG
ncbi:MAG: class I SAM-dependent methyltransferase [Hyphomonadaceae bacterium]|nr:class I SAM-dependent methyltransferase [Hyphomonadaceae bacterium]